MNQEADLPVCLKRQFTDGPGDLRRDNQITADFFAGQTFEQLQLVFLQAFEITGEISYGSTFFFWLIA
jgi:hypothetical protein